ncbi:MAG: carbon-nitrogen hydrolase family protein [Planctomycetota bacterium]
MRRLNRNDGIEVEAGMKFCMAQIRSSAGRVNGNVEVHIEMARQAAARGADLVVFPELSVTGYEPELAGRLAMDLSDPRLAAIRSASVSLQIAISAGFPLKQETLPCISMMTFYPNRESQLYTKQRLHVDELPFFSNGTKQVILQVRGTRICPGICYETRFEESFQQAKELNADVYTASVAKPNENIDEAYEHYARVSKRFEIITAVSNCVGPAGDFMGAGQSAAWGTDGRRLASMGEKATGLLLVDSIHQTAECIEW